LFVVVVAAVDSNSGLGVTASFLSRLVSSVCPVVVVRGRMMVVAGLRLSGATTLLMMVVENGCCVSHY
jgi:hypothetical protein